MSDAVLAFLTAACRALCRLSDGAAIFISCLMVTIYSDSLRRCSLCLLFRANGIFDHINRVDALASIYCSVQMCSVLDHVNQGLFCLLSGLCTLH